jgi:hypothetical protein
MGSANWWMASASWWMPISEQRPQARQHGHATFDSVITAITPRMARHFHVVFHAP